MDANTLHWVDYCALAIIVTSIVISLLRGFAKEALSLASWLVALWISLHFSESLSSYFPTSVSNNHLRLVAAFFSLFLTCLLLGTFINFLVGHLIQKTGLSGTDRVLGLVFGASRGVLIVAALLFVAGFTSLPENDWWHASPIVAHFAPLDKWMLGLLPHPII